MIKDINLKILCGLGWHLGHTRQKTPFLATWNVSGLINMQGIKSVAYYILNLTQIIMRAKRLIERVQLSIALNNHFFFVTNDNNYIKYVSRYAILSGMSYNTGFWLNGILANWPQLRVLVEKLQQQREQFSLFFKQQKMMVKLSGLQSLQLPSAIFLIKWSSAPHILRECNHSGIPTITTLDTDYVSFGNFNSLPGNNSSLLCCNFFLNLIYRQTLLAKVKYLIRFTVKLKNIKQQAKLKMIWFFSSKGDEFMTFNQNNESILLLSHYNIPEIQGLTYFSDLQKNWLYN